jgi:hypothetical protein
MSDPYAAFSRKADADPYAGIAVRAERAPAPAKPKRDAVMGGTAAFDSGVPFMGEFKAAMVAGVDAAEGKGPFLERYKAERERQMQRRTGFTEDHPIAANALRTYGGATTMAIPAGGAANAFRAPLVVAGRQVAPVVANALRGATLASGEAALYGAATQPGGARERLQAAREASTNPAVLALGAAGGGLSTPRAPKPKAKVDPNVAALRAKGVQLTPGQARGGIAKATEDAATSLPILGTAIQEARQGSVETFNRAVANDALAPIGQKVPSNIPAGHQMVAYTEQKLRDAYNATIPKRTVAADPEFRQGFATRISDIAQDMTEAGRARLHEILQQRVAGRFDENGGVLTGEQFQRVNSELDTTRKRFAASQDADQRAIAEGIEAVQDELRSAAARQDPAFAKRKAAIDKGYALFKRQQSAAAAQGAEGGVFTPAQYGGSVRRGDKSLDKGASARGGALGQEFADQARAVLPSKTPDSGTATRGALVAAGAAGAKVAGAVMAGHPLTAVPTIAGGAAALGGLKLAARAYAPEAIAAANAALDARITAQGQAQALAQLKAMAQRDPAVAQLYRAVAERLSRSAAVAASPSAPQSASPAQ